MPDRYFVDKPIVGDRAMLAGAEAHHLMHVMRAVPGLEVILFDGGGDEFRAVVERVGRGEVHLTVLARERVDRELPLKLTLGVALPKGDRQRWLVEKATELGVGRLVPLLTARAVARPGGQSLSRLRRAVVEASKQCGRNRLMEIGPPLSWPEFIAQTAGRPNRLLAHPGRSGVSDKLNDRRNANVEDDSRGLTAPGGIAVRSGAFRELLAPGYCDASFAGDKSDRLAECHLAVGPEGGFTAGEVAAAVESGWQPVNLGPRILRVETAALALVAAAAQQCRWD